MPTTVTLQRVKLLISDSSVCFGAASELRGASIPDDHKPLSSRTQTTNDWNYAELSDKTLASLCVFHVPDKPSELQVNL